MDEKIYLLPISRGYWKSAVRELTLLKKLILASLLISLSIALEVLATVVPIVIFGRKIMFTFLPAAVMGFTLGPVLGPIAGTVADVGAWLVYSGGYPFFPGYTLSQALSVFIFALALYRTQISVVKVSLAKLIINVAINAFLGALWLTLMMASKKTFWELVIAGLVKNLILWPFEVVLILLLVSSLVVPSQYYGYIAEGIRPRPGL